MWDEQKRQRFQQLRQHPDQLNGAERAELDGLIQELEAAESTYLAGATKRLREEREFTQRQNRSLEMLANRRNALVQRLDRASGEARAEQFAIASELASVLAGQDSSNHE